MYIHISKIMYTIYSFIAGAYSVTYVGYTATAICISVTIPIYNVPLCLLILHNFAQICT